MPLKDAFMEALLHHFETPFTDPVLIFAVVMLMLLVAPLAVRKMRLPEIIGLLLAGVIAGPNALGLLERDATFQLLGTVGLLYIMFTAGLEIDLNRFAKYRNHSLVFGVLTFIVPQTIGTLAGMYILGLDFMVAILLASMFASHTLLAYPVTSRLGVSKSNAVTATVGGTVITDTAALLVLAVVMGSTRGSLDMNFWLTLVIGLSIYVALVFWSIPRVGRWFLRKVGSEGVVEYVFVLAVVFLAAFMAELAGVEAIIGAFMAGLALNRLIPESSTLMNRIEFVGNALFIPFFLISVGMLVDVRVLFSGAAALIVAATMVAAALFSKWLAALLTQKVLGYSRDEQMVIFGLSAAQAAATLAVVLVAFDVGLFDETVLNGTIVMIAVTCFVSPIVTERFGRRMALAQEAQGGSTEDEAPQRFLVPLANAAHARALLDFTFLVREHGSEEPVFPLSVVPEEGDTAQAVASAERMLSAAVVHGASAEVPVVPVTRMAHNLASGMARAVLERRVSDLVVGWSGPAPPSPSARRANFGVITDQLLQQTEQQVFINHLTQPINTVRRVIVVFPPLIEYHPGYTRALRDVKRLTNAMGALLTGLCLKDEIRRIRGRFDTIKPEIASSFVGFNTMEDLVVTLQRRVEEHDLLIFLSARQGTLPWSPELDALPTRLQALAAYSMSFLFLSDIDEAKLPAADEEQGLAEAFKPRRVRVAMEETDEREALYTLLSSYFEEDASQTHLQEVVEALLRDDPGFSRELVDGVTLVNARSEYVHHPLVFAATRPEGFQTEARTESPVFLMLVALSPLESPLQEHLELFSELGALATRVLDARSLAQLETPTELVEELKRLARDTQALFPDARDEALDMSLTRTDLPG
ncbi:cation:proton antiporter [Lujinxingia sediminis]|uniref:Cation:proton antiporter n=1 Tax=Lujinxingia sediminis TaxID=2480984 RepID=A0ABY0CP43_9DELT|nr:cation:proton antiporter [Lujinxingia sediminis]RVU42231.1 cation:proton antiporter [Lujinxingia sediminis]